MEHHRQLSFILPSPKDLPNLALSLLNDNNSDNLQDFLLHSSTQVSNLNDDVSHLNNRLLNLRTDLTKLAVSWISTSLSAKSSLDDLKSNLKSLSLLTVGKQTNQELKQLVDELCRIQNIRRYFVIALKLESLVGDVEDSVFHRNHKGRSMIQDHRIEYAIKTMNEIEEVLSDVNSQWKHLVDCVDSRIDKSLSILRPQVIAEHRAFLSSIGWPPKLATSNIEHGSVGSISNPLVSMQEDRKKSYSQSFLLLCGLQQLNTKKENRKKLSVIEEANLRIWGIDELVAPLASRMENHFMKWIDRTEFIFALVYKVTRDFANGFDDFLQPLIDQAMLVSYSAKEAWVASMVQMLSSFLEKKVFPRLIDEKHTKSEGVSSWFHLVDQMITFDKRIQSFVNSDTTSLFGEGSSISSSQGMSVMGLFCKKPEWLKTWGKIELKDAYRKMKEDAKNEKAWVVNIESSLRFATREDYKAPFIADSFVDRTWKLIDRGLSLPAIQPRIRFLKATATKLLWGIFKILLLEFEKIDLFEDTLIQACRLINAAQYLESKLREWSDDLVLVEMCDCFFEEELKTLVEFETDWIMEIITVCLNQFDTLCSDHFRNYSDSCDKEEVSSGSISLTVSRDFAEALDSLRSNLCVLELNMNKRDFLDLWRNLAEGIDHYVSCKFFSGEIFFQKEKFEVEVEALLMVFQRYCVRPVAFFPRLREILRLKKGT